MNFQVPQFIEVEDKPIGPFTFKQFFYLAGGAGLSFIIWTYIPFHILAVIIIIPIALLSLALSFYKINNRPFIVMMEAALRFLVSKKLFLWQKKEKPVKGTNIDSLVGTAAPVQMPRLSQSKLSDLSWSLDIQEKIK